MSPAFFGGFTASRARGDKIRRRMAFAYVKRKRNNRRFRQTCIRRVPLGSFLLLRFPMPFCGLFFARLSGNASIGPRSPGTKRIPRRGFVRCCARGKASPGSSGIRSLEAIQGSEGGSIPESHRAADGQARRFLFGKHGRSLSAFLSVGLWKRGGSERSLREIHDEASPFEGHRAKNGAKRIVGRLREVRYPRGPSKRPSS